MLVFPARRAAGVHRHYEAIAAVINPLRNELTPMYGRLLTKFPKPFVEKLFPRESRTGEVEGLCHWRFHRGFPMLRPEVEWQYDARSRCWSPAQDR